MNEVSRNMAALSVDYGMLFGFLFSNRLDLIAVRPNLVKMLEFLSQSANLCPFGTDEPFPFREVLQQVRQIKRNLGLNQRRHLRLVPKPVI